MLALIAGAVAEASGPTCYLCRRMALTLSPDTRIAVIGLGYVGLPLAVEFGKRYPTTGYDIQFRRVSELRDGHDSTLEVSPEDLASAAHLQFTDELESIAGSDVFVVTVPTPIDAHKRPDLGPLELASQAVGSVLRRGNIVIFESTVYPGCTEEICVPILERISGLRFNHDFFCGYSPERINPGDRTHRVTDIRKVTSGSTDEAAGFVDALYQSIITAGTHRAPSIKVAEAAKVIENTQRDLNIALVNDLAMLFDKLGIDTQDVLDAAATKWNFIPFRPGLVGGHCISVDPYYLTHKAEQVGHHPDVILAGRRTNDGMGIYVAKQVMTLMADKGVSLIAPRVLVLGLAFKENCPDLRNTRVVDVIETLRKQGAMVDVHDPRVDAHEALREYDLALIDAPAKGAYDAIVLAVAHQEFLDLDVATLRGWGRPDVVLYDVKSVLPREWVDGRL